MQQASTDSPCSSGRQEITVFRDTNHHDVLPHQFLASSETMQVLQQRGYKHLFLEIPSLMDGIVQDYQDHKIDESVLRQAFEDQKYSLMHLPREEDKMAYIDAVVSIAKQGREMGIRVHCRDVSQEEKTEQFPEISARMNAFREKLHRAFEKAGFTEAYKRDHPEEVDAFREKYIADNQLDNEYKQFKRDNMFIRLDDTLYAQRIMDTAQGENAAIMAGLGHKDLIDRLQGAASIYAVELQGDKVKYPVRSRIKYGFPSDEFTDEVMIIPEGKALTFPSSSQPRFSFEKTEEKASFGFENVAEALPGLQAVSYLGEEGNIRPQSTPSQRSPTHQACK